MRIGRRPISGSRLLNSETRHRLRQMRYRSAARRDVSLALDMTGFGGAAFECQTTLVRLLSVAMHVPAAPEEVSLALDMKVMLPWSTPDNGA